MQGQTVHIVSQAIRYMEDYQNNRLDDSRLCAEKAAYRSGKTFGVFTKTNY